jgi:hypothetical protein
MSTVDKLLGARLKLKRADKHIADLHDALSTFKKSNPCRIGTKRDPNTRCLSYYIESFDDVPSDIGLIAADTLFNLRSALDHVVMQLWITGGRQGKEAAVMFPIFDSPSKYSAQKHGKIQGLRPDAVKAIDFIQPYKGGRGQSLWVLHELNNTDKHRLLLTVGGGFNGMNIGPVVNRELKRLGAPGEPVPVLEVSDPRLWTCPLKVGAILFTDMPDTELHEDVYFLFDVALGEPGIAPGESVLKTLQDMSKLVADIVDQLGRLL